ncbi:protein-disulfide reductase DsbD N-terminal domain-containing protein [Mucilaginibacter calamicampi]|uniref:Protein-disulfide reductase DsbD N-terminal domain-containing protein n=1 Tax=Mucilaginibacter calamicampi TaxID=1302352 RepID=A0ABW2Z3F6_9SPHI
MKKVLALAAALMLTLGAFAQIENPVKWAYAAKRTSATDATVFIKATIEDGWHVYSQYVEEGGPIKTSFTFSKSKDYTLAGKTAEPKAVVKFDKQFKMNIGFFEKEVLFEQKVKLKSANAATVKGKLEFMVCNDHKCLPPDEIAFNVAVPAKK